MGKPRPLSEGADLEKIGTYTIHPLASVYPFIPPGKEWDDFKESIKRKGIEVPISIDRKSGQVVDGRNRLKAYFEIVEEQKASGGIPLDRYASIPSREEDFRDFEEIARFIRVRNEFRRHLTEDGLVVCVAEMQKIVVAQEAKKRKAPKKGEVRNPHGIGGKSGKELIVNTESYSQSIEPPKRDTKEMNARSTVGRIASEAGVSHHKAAQAIKAVETAPPEDLEKVKRGEVKLREIVPKAEKKPKAEPAKKAPTKKAEAPKVETVEREPEEADIQKILAWLDRAPMEWVSKVVDHGRRVLEASAHVD